MKTCKRCGAKIPVWVRIGDRLHNFNSRSYCLDCSPFGQHNTRNLIDEDLRKSLKGMPESGRKVCARCGVEKTVDEFYVHGKNQRLYPECRKCFNNRST